MIVVLLAVFNFVMRYIIDVADEEEEKRLGKDVEAESTTVAGKASDLINLSITRV